MLVGANLDGLILSDADLSNADLENASLQRSGLFRAKLSCAGIRGANSTESSLNGAVLRFSIEYSR